MNVITSVQHVKIRVNKQTFNALEFSSGLQSSQSSRERSVRAWARPSGKRDDEEPRGGRGGWNHHIITTLWVLYAGPWATNQKCCSSGGASRQTLQAEVVYTRKPTRTREKRRSKSRLEPSDPEPAEYETRSRLFIIYSSSLSFSATRWFTCCLNKSRVRFRRFLRRVSMFS